MGNILSNNSNGSKFAAPTSLIAAAFLASVDNSEAATVSFEGEISTSVTQLTAPVPSGINLGSSIIYDLSINGDGDTPITIFATPGLVNLTGTFGDYSFTAPVTIKLFDNSGVFNFDGLGVLSSRDEFIFDSDAFIAVHNTLPIVTTVTDIDMSIFFDSATFDSSATLADFVGGLNQAQLDPNAPGSYFRFNADFNSGGEIRALTPGSIPFTPVIPEPSSLALLGLAGAGLALRRRRQNGEGQDAAEQPTQPAATHLDLDGLG